MTEELNTDIEATPPIRHGRRAERQLRRAGGAQLIGYEDQRRLLAAILDVCGYVFDHTPFNISALSAELQWYDPVKVVDGLRQLHTAGHIHPVKHRETARYKQPKRWQVGNRGG